MMVGKQDFLNKLDEVKSREDTEILFQSANTLLADNPSDIEVLHARAQLYVKLQELGKAINDYTTIITLDKDDKIAATQIIQLKSILKYNNTDIYASPNTNFDPWLD